MAASFTEQQVQILSYLREHRRAAVFGCAGSGKTTIATHLAAELDGGGASVLLVCRNPYLAAHLRARLQQTGVAVFAFNELMGAIKQAADDRRNSFRESAGGSESEIAPTSKERPSPNDNAGASVVMPAEAGIQERLTPLDSRLRGNDNKMSTSLGWQAPWTEYEAPTLAEINTAIDHLAHTSLRYDAVIVDEGQDFQESWLDVAEACLFDPASSRFYIFFDDNPLLGSFDVKRLYETIRAPVTLTQNCRSAAEIAALVEKLRPDRADRVRQAGGEGEAVREYLYYSETEMFAQLRLALLAAEQISPGLEEAVVLSAETNPSRLSKFAGFVFETPTLAADAPQAGLPWRSAVLRSLQGLGLLESDLSAAALPSREDIRRVNRFCSAYRASHRASLKHQPATGDRLALQWKLGNYGELTLRWREDRALEVPKPDLLRFFESPGWAAALPPAHKRYRLSPGGQLPPHPYYQDVLLADIPSFKGMESAAVVFMMYNEFARDQDDLMATLYVAFSRARCGLMIVNPNTP